MLEIIICDIRVEFLEFWRKSKQRKIKKNEIKSDLVQKNILYPTPKESRPKILLCALFFLQSIKRKRAVVCATAVQTTGDRTRSRGVKPVLGGSVKVTKNLLSGFQN